MNSSISCPPDDIQLPNDGRSSCMMSNSADELRISAEDHGYGDRKGVIVVDSGSAQAEAAEDGDAQLWPRLPELEGRPPSPTSLSDIAIKHVISESSHQSSCRHLKDEDMESAVVDDSSEQETSKSDQQTETQKDCLTSSPDTKKPATPQEPIPDDFPADLSPPNHRRPPLLGVARSDRVHPSPPMHERHASIMESYLVSAEGGRLSSVVEESESFARREFGDFELHYMSTGTSAKHDINLPSLFPNESRIGDKHAIHRHNNYHKFNYNLRISQEPAGHGRIASSKSAPAGTATRTGSAFGLFRRGASEHSGLRMNKQAVYIPSRPRKRKTLASTILWPLVKIKDGYVGCMMGLEGTGDLRGVAQGGTCGDSAWYFADVPLSKSDLRNYG